MNSFRVAGTVHDERGVPAAGRTVEVLDQRLGGELRIGATAVRPDGRYMLDFDPEPVRVRPGASLDLIVQVVTDDRIIARAPTRFGATELELVDVVVPAGTHAAVDEHSR